jgi:hypothetical protein
MQRRDASAYAAELAGTFLPAYVLGPVAGALAAAGAYSAIVLRGRPALWPVDKLGRA